MLSWTEHPDRRRFLPPAHPPTPAGSPRDGHLTWSIPEHRYGDLRVLDHVHGAVAPGQRRAIIGPNGAGKTTLLHVLAGNLRPRGAQISIGGRDITRSGPARRSRAGIGRTFQTPTCLPELTVRDNLLLAGWTHHRPRPWRSSAAARRAADERVDATLTRLNLHGCGDRPAGVLSHGQRRLLDIGMAVASTPSVLLLDEPAAGLTDDDRTVLLNVLRERDAHVAVLLVEHDLDLVAAVADQVTVLHQGRCIAEGTPDEVRADPLVQRVYLGVDPAVPPC